MLESKVERRLKRLEQHGFAVLKLKTPGYNGVPDRMVLYPKYHPAPPRFVEIKRPGKELRALQAEIALSWRERGVRVWPMCDTLERVDEFINFLLDEVRFSYFQHTGTAILEI